MRRLRSHLTYANVMATIAVFLVLGGGSAVALSGSNTVFSDDIVDNQVYSADVRNDTLSGGGLGAPDLRPNSVASSEAAANSLKGVDIDESQLDATPLRTRVAQGGCGEAMAGTGEMVQVGPTCIDRFEASVWSSPTGGTQYGISSDDYPCNDDGQNCDNIYARSVAGVQPSSYITYFQAQQALANSGKRLPLNAEWQAAVAGTPENQCGVNDAQKSQIGVYVSCVSRFGAYGMVANVAEWVGDWDEESDFCGTTFSGDRSCFGQDNTNISHVPGALIRGGGYGDGTLAGPFDASAAERPEQSFPSVGFRGAR
jgi:hypothetical protein